MMNTRAERLRSPQPAGRLQLRLVAPETSDASLSHLDAAAAVGQDPFKPPVRLWMEKTGRQELLRPQSALTRDDSLAYWSRLLEPIVAAHYTLCTGHRIRRVAAQHRHPHYPWMVATVTREVVAERDVQMLECLSVGLDEAPLWAQGVPAHIRLRVLHQLAVTGLRAADVVALVGGQDLRIHRIERDEAAIAWLIDKERAFWLCVEFDQAPSAGEDEKEEGNVSG